MLQERFQNALASLFGRIKDFAIRETKETANIHLPGKEIRQILVGLEPRQAELYEKMRKECALVVLRDGKPILDNAEAILKRLLRLVQISANPRLVDKSYTAIPGKFPILESLLDSIVDSREKAIVWTSFTENVDWLVRHLGKLNAVRLHGKMNYESRNKAIRTFVRNPDNKVLIATPGSAKEGLTLTVANHAIFYDRAFSLDDYLQAQDRIHRISQTRTCFVTNLTAEGTVDEWVDVLLAAKHLAAQLGQGDITRDRYEADASYAFGQMVREVLGIP